ncbi:hypothetical protein [Flavobacterium phage FL-1]|nr:hypothetical protein [Flavobacterium phage FL-1]
MNTTDILLFEAGGGGDLAIINNDLSMGESLYQQIYLSLFGGNVEESTKQFYLDNEERFDYWGNTLIWNDVKTKQFNSETERTIKSTVLNSSGRIRVIQAAENDLAYLQPVANISVDAQVLNRDQIRLIISFSGKTNQQDKLLQIVYDNAKGSVIIEETI